MKQYFKFECIKPFFTGEIPVLVGQFVTIDLDILYQDDFDSAITNEDEIEIRIHNGINMDFEFLIKMIDLVKHFKYVSTVSK